MSRLFKKIPDSEKRTIRLEVRLTKAEKDSITNRAKFGNMSTSEYMRRKSLNKRTDVKFEEQAVLAIRSVGDSIKKLREEYVEKGVPIPEKKLEIVLTTTTLVMQSLHRCRK